MTLPYESNSFDVVLIANALHIVPAPEKVLMEINRVLWPGGLLIVPNFAEHKETTASRIWSDILRMAGVRFEHQWSARECLEFLEGQGWKALFPSGDGGEDCFDVCRAYQERRDLRWDCLRVL